MHALFRFLVAVGFCCSGRLHAGPAPTPHPTNRVFLASVGRGSTRIFAVGTARVSTWAELQVAVTVLPAGTELYWDTGCIMYRSVPLQGPEPSVEEVRAFCASRSVAFTHVVSGY